MRELGRLGGVKSGEKRRQNAIILRMAEMYSVWEATGKRFSPEQVVEAMRHRISPAVTTILIGAARCATILIASREGPARNAKPSLRQTEG